MISQGLILGSKGMLGSDIVKLFSKSGIRVLTPSHVELDLTQHIKVYEFFVKYRPSWVINCVAKHDLLACEKYSDAAMKINSEAVENLAIICSTFNVYLIHISTDYVFDGLKGLPYIESDSAIPVNQYGHSKLSGEVLALNRNTQTCVVRVSALFGASISRDKRSHCFVDRMKSKLLSGHELSVNDDQVVSPTSTLEVARQLKELIQFKPVGTIHCAGNGFTSWYNLTLEIAKNIHIPTNKVKILKTSSVSGDGVLRPLNSSLENKRLKELNLNLMRDWDFSLNNYLNEFNQ